MRRHVSMIVTVAALAACLAGAGCSSGSAAHKPEAQKVTVPSVVGRSGALAASALQDAGLVVGEMTTEENAEQGERKLVLRQTPEAGAKVAGGTTVDLVIAVPATSGTVKVPDVATSGTMA